MPTPDSRTGNTSIHPIQVAPLPQRYARGWHCLGLAQDYRDGKPHSLDIFGTHLVAYEGEDRQIHILDGYCPHMGADLSRGCIEGNAVTCPFHGWQWGGDGVCAHIPYAKRIPPKARIKSWQTLEQNRLLFVWHDPEDGPPDAEVEIPRIEACFSDEWSDWRLVKWDIDTNCRELVDNVADMAHFGPVHGIPAEYFCNSFRGHVAHQIMRGTNPRLSAETSRTTADSAYFGPAYHITLMTTEMDGSQHQAMLLNCHVPVDQNRFELRFGVKVKKDPRLSEEANEAQAQAYTERAKASFFEDVEIWHNKTRVDNPLLCEGDGPIYPLRAWYRQFYVDRAELPNDLHIEKNFEYRAETGKWLQLGELPLDAASRLFSL